MEASAAGPAAATGDPAGEQDPNAATPQMVTQQDFSQLQELVKGIPEQQNEMRDLLRGLQPQEEAPAPASLDLTDLYEDALMQPDPDDLSQRFQEYTDQKVQEQMQPLIEEARAAREEAAEVRRSQEMTMLRQEMPEMEDPDTAREVITLTQQYADMLGPQYSELGGDPKFMKVIAYAARAIQAAQEEGAETPDAAALENSNGSRPGLSGDQAEQVFSEDAQRPRVVGW